jgi:hypothetical protein
MARDFRFSLLLVALLGCVLFASCSSSFVTEPELAAASASADAKLAELKAAVEVAPSEAERVELVARVDDLTAKATELATVREALKVDDANAAAVAATVSTVGSAVPVPFVNTLFAVLGSTGVVSAIVSAIARARNSRIASQIIAGIEAAKNPLRTPPDVAAQLSAALIAAKPWIHAAMDVSTVQAVRDAINNPPAPKL